MKPAQFDYVAPRTVDGCVAALAEAGDEAKIIAGGQSLMPMMALRLARPEVLVDVNRVEELTRRTVTDDAVTLGAVTRHSTLESDPEIAAILPLLRLAAPFIGHFQIRTRGTLGGSMAHADAAAELPCAARLMDAVFVLRGPDGSREVPARDFFEGVFTTALEADEMVTAVRYPRWPADSAFAVDEVARRHGDFAIVGAMCGLHATDGTVDRFAVSLSGMGGVPQRSEAAEKSVVGRPLADVDAQAFADELIAQTDPTFDVHASAKYRAQVGAALVRRVIERTLEEVSHAG